MGAHKPKLSSSIWEVEAEEPGAQGQPKLQSKAILGYISFCLKNQNQTSNQSGDGEWNWDRMNLPSLLFQNCLETGERGLEEDKHYL